MAPNRRRLLWMATLVGVSLLGFMPAGANHDDDEDEARERKYYRYEKRIQKDPHRYRAEPERRSGTSMPPARIQQGGST